MRISALFMDGFGIFHNLSVEDLPPGFILFSGDNEAGKSTCLWFIRDMLFGFRDKRSKDNEYPPLSGGTQGGRLTFVSRRFGEISLERKAGKKGGLVSVTHPDGRKAGEEALVELLGGTTRELYRNVYAFSLSELQSMETLDNDAVKSALYGAGMGTGVRALSTAMTTIGKKLDELFKPGGRSPEINRRLRDLEDIRDKLRTSRQELKRYDEASQGLRHTAEVIEEYRAAIRSSNREKERVDTYLKVWDDAVLLKTFERELADLPLKIESFPSKGVERLDRLGEKIEGKEALCATLAGEHDEALRELQNLHADERLLEQSESVRELLSGKATYVADRAAISALRQQIEAIGKSIGTALTELGRDWTEQKALSLDRSLFAREEIERQRQTLEDLKSGRVNAENSFAARKEDLDSAIRDEEEAGKELERTPAVEREADEETIAQLQKGRDQFASTVADLPGIRKEREKQREGLKDAIREISADWREEEIASFDCSIAAREKVGTFERMCANLEAEVRDAESRIDATSRDLEASRVMVGQKTREIGEIGPIALTREELAARKTSLRTLRALVGTRDKLSLKIDYEKQRLEDKEEEKAHYTAGLRTPPGKTAKLVSFAAILLGAVILMLSVPAGSHAWSALGICVVLAGMLGCALYAAALKASSANAAAARSRLAELDRRISAAAFVLDEAGGSRDAVDRKIENLTTAAPEMHGQYVIEALDREEAAVDEEMRRCERIISLVEDQKTWSGRAEKAMEAMEQGRKKKEAGETRLRTAEKEWEAYLRSARLPSGMTPRTVHQVFPMVENIRSQLTTLAEIEERIKRMEKHQRDYLSVAAGVRSFGALSDPDPANFLPLLDALLRRDLEIVARLHEREKAEAKYKDRSDRVGITKKARDDAKAILDKAAEDEERGWRLWREWLLAAGFDQPLSPSTTMEALHKIDEAVRGIDERADLTARLRNCENHIRAYQELAAGLCETLTMPVPADERLVSAVEALENAYEKAKTERTKKEGLRKHLEDIEFRTGRARGELARLREDVAALLTEAGAGSEEAFRERAALYEKRNALLADKEKTEKDIKKLSGREEISSLKGELHHYSKDGLKTTSDECASRLADFEEQLQQAYQEKAALSQEMSSLASADDISLWRLEEEEIIEEVRLQALEWGSYAIARHLLAEATKRFQEEQQPKVISDASRFFKVITGGRYERIVAPIGEDTIEIASPQGQTKRPEHLSRGTAEQLYLALRFGYITNFTAGGENLPVIMDEILVNFDAVRAGQAAAAILALADTHQVIYFTCHPEIAGMFRSRKKDIPVYCMRDGQITRG
jgi:uncharacterized protein YhaN